MLAVFEDDVGGDIAAVTQHVQARGIDIGRREPRHQIAVFREPVVIIQIRGQQLGREGRQFPVPRHEIQRGQWKPHPHRVAHALVAELAVEREGKRVQDGNYRATLPAERFAFREELPHQALPPELRRRLQAADCEHLDVLSAEPRVAHRENTARHHRAVGAERFEAERIVRNGFSDNAVAAVHVCTFAYKYAVTRR